MTIIPMTDVSTATGTAPTPGSNKKEGPKITCCMDHPQDLCLDMGYYSAQLGSWEHRARDAQSRTGFVDRKAYQAKEKP